jgi:polysaccharide export outer membrane protein
MKHMPNNRSTPSNVLGTVACSLLLVFAIAMPQTAAARDTRATQQSANAPVTPTQAANTSNTQARNTPPAVMPAVANANSQSRETLGPGDSIRITVFQNPDLTTESRLSQSGSIVFPLIGEVGLGGLTTAEAGARIADQLKRGNFIVNPQVAVSIVQVRSRQVHVLGQVSRPGNYVLEDSATRLTDVLTLAGGISTTGADTVTVLTNRNGKPERRMVDVPSIFQGGDPATNMQIENGDTIFVERAPVFYIYGEVQRAGAYRWEPNMIVMQALSLGSGLTPRASARNIGIHRRMPDGKFAKLDAKLTDPIQADDIVFVRESLF